MATTSHDPYRWQPSSPLRRTATAAATAFCAASLVLAALVLAPGIAGYERYVITSGSMTGTYDRGSLIFDEIVPVSELSVGDVITYTPPAGAGPSGMLTHRIESIASDQAGRRVYRTKGDANETADPWTFTLEQPTQARVAFHVPYVGYVFAALSVRDVRTALIGLPALLLALGVVAGLRREARRAAVSGSSEARS
jgi:signal peptidase